MQVEIGLTHPFLWKSGKSENVEVTDKVYFLFPSHLARKIEADSAHRVVGGCSHPLLTKD